MSTERFSTGKQFIWKDIIYEVRQLLPSSQLNIENSVTGEIRTVTFVELLEALFNHQLWFLKPSQKGVQPPPAYIDLGNVPPKLRQIAEYRLSVIQPLLEIPRERRTLTIIQERVRDVKFAQEMKEMEEIQRSSLEAVGKSSIYKWIKMYTESGEDIRALIPNVHRQGGRSKRRLQSETEAIIKTVIEDRYYVREVVTISDIHHEVALRISEENISRVETDKLKLPSRATVARRIKALDAEKVVTAKHGRDIARRQFTQSDAMVYPTIPLVQVEIDHTLTDVIVIDDKDNLPLGRLTFTLCLDTATRYPLGYYIGFEPPSYLTVMECLFHAIMPKGNVREQFGTEHDWIAYGIPHTLVVDNGREFIGKDLEDSCHSLGITLRPLPVRSPELKPAVERIFGTINTGLFHKLPGTTFSNIGQRGNYDSVKNATITLTELDKLIHIHLLDIYAESLNRGLQGIPARRWEDVTRDGFFPRVPKDPNDLLISLGRIAYRTIQKYGVEFESLRYNAPELSQLRTRMNDEAGRLHDNWSERKGKQVKIKYHPGDMSRIYVYDPFDQVYIEVPALAVQYTEGLSLWKHKVVRRLVLDEQDSVDIEALGRAKRHIQEVVNRSKQEKKKNTHKKTGRWDAGGKENRSSQTDGVDKNKRKHSEPATLSPSLLDFDIDNDDESGWSVSHTLPIGRKKTTDGEE